MLNLHGVDVNDIARIEREQFDYFMGRELERSAAPNDWPSIREPLVLALAAARGVVPSDAFTRSATGVLEEARHEADFRSQWPTFIDVLWEKARAMPGGLEASKNGHTAELPS